MPRLTAVRDREDAPLHDTWTPDSWFEVLPGVKVLSSFAYNSAMRLAPFRADPQKLIAYLRDRYGVISRERVKNGRRELVRTAGFANTPVGLPLQLNECVVLTRQGVPDLDRAKRRGYNGNRSSCPHKLPGIVPTLDRNEYVDDDGRRLFVVATYCTGCEARLWDSRDKAN